MHQTISQYNLMTKLSEKYSHSTYLASPINEPEHQVVLTLFASSLCYAPQERESLLLKVARIKQLQHNHIAPILDMGIKKEQVFTIREYLAHESVRNLLKSLFPQGLELQDALNLILQVGDALMHAHDLHIFHGNLKPENVLLDANGQAVLTDFSIINKHDILIRDNMTDKYPLCYMAPEQLFGAGDAKSDQYMLGCLTYELITGRPPFVAQNIDLMRSQHNNAEPVSFFEGNADLPASLEAAVLKTLEKDPGRRFADLSQFLESIRSIASPPVISATTHFSNFKSKRLFSNFMLSKKRENASSTMIKYTAFPSFDSQKQEPSPLMKDTITDIEEEQHTSFMPQVSTSKQAKPIPLIKKPAIEIEEEQHTSFMPQISTSKQAKPIPLIKKPAIEIEEEQHTSFMPQISTSKQAKPIPLIKKPAIEIEEEQHTSFMPQVSTSKQAKPIPLIKKPAIEIEEEQHTSFMPQVSTSKQAKPIPLIKKPAIEIEEEQHTSFMPQVSTSKQAKPIPLIKLYAVIFACLQWVRERVNFQLSHTSLRRKQAYTLTQGETELNLTSEKGHVPHETTYRRSTRYFLRTAMGLAVLLSVIVGMAAYAFWLPGPSIPDTHLYTASSTSDNSMATNSTPTLLTDSIPSLRTNSTPTPVTSSSTTTITITNTIATSRINSIPTLVASSSATTKANPTPVATNPTPVATNPTPVAANPTPVAANPTPVAANPTPVAANPTPATINPTPAVANPTPTPHSSQTTVIDDSIQGTGSNQLHYVGGGWQHVTNICQANPCEYNNGNSWDSTASDYVTITFTGVQLRFYGVVDPKHGIGAASIDGGSETMIDFYAADRAGNQLLWTSPMLQAGTHTFKLRVTGNKNPKSSNTFTIVDRVDILS